jgi:hypothetical protein
VRVCEKAGLWKLLSVWPENVHLPCIPAMSNCSFRPYFVKTWSCVFLFVIALTERSCRAHFSQGPRSYLRICYYLPQNHLFYLLQRIWKIAKFNPPTASRTNATHATDFKKPTVWCKFCRQNLSDRSRCGRKFRTNTIVIFVHFNKNLYLSIKCGKF